MATQHEEPSVKLARDEFTVERRRLDGHPEVVKASSRIDVADDYGNVTTWVVDLYRLDGSVTAFVQRGAPDGYIRIVVPPLVTAAISRHQAGLITKHRRKVARRSVADLRAQSGEEV
jgi:hypothetical protein